MADESSSPSQRPIQHAGGGVQLVELEQAGKESTESLRQGHRLSNMWSELSLPRVQAIVAILTGVVTIAGAFFSLTQFLKPADSMGELVAVVREAGSEKSVADATIEILNPLNALVATLTPDSTGRARQSLKEGIYTVRVSHPRYSAEVRQIQIFSKQTVELKASLRTGSSAPAEHAKRTVNDGVRAVRRVLGF